jgi:hypothetical protein
MPFAGNRLMINKQSGRDVSEAMKTLPIASAQSANRELITRERQSNEYRQASESNPDEWLGKTMDQSIPSTFVEHMGREM